MLASRTTIGRFRSKLWSRREWFRERKVKEREVCGPKPAKYKLKLLSTRADNRRIEEQKMW